MGVFLKSFDLRLQELKFCVATSNVICREGFCAGRQFKLGKPREKGIQVIARPEMSLEQ